MVIKHQDLEISEESPFKNCKLGRKNQASVLSKVVNSYKNGFVLAINNQWGTGKTTFVKMWRQNLVNEGHKTVYFNAWENDFEASPLVAILSELKPFAKDSAVFKGLLSKGAAIAKAIIPTVIKGAADKYINVDLIDSALEKAAEIGADFLQKRVEEYTSHKKGLKEFKDALQLYIEKIGNDKPLVLIIDELDRCRPNYAVEVLEHIKHFFSVRGIVFVLSIDKEQLGHAVRGAYGSDRINSEDYLRRFIDIEYSLPTPESDAYCKYLYHYFEFDEFLGSAERVKYSEFTNDKEYFLKFSAILFDRSKLTLRQQEKIFAHTRLVLKSFGPQNYIFSTLLVLLVYLRDFKRELYDSIVSKSLDVYDINDKFYYVVPKDIPDEDIRFFLYTEAQLVNLYSNYADRLGKRALFTTKGDSKICNVKSKMDKTSENTVFISMLESAVQHRDWSTTSLDYLLKKINLFEDINV